jgi:hypothetical protein
MLGQLMNWTEIWKEKLMAQSKNSLDNWQDEVKKINIHFFQHIHKRSLHSDQASSEKQNITALYFPLFKSTCF